jgi:hypothetical protein
MGPNLYSSQNIIRMIKSERLNGECSTYWVTGGERNVQLESENSKRKDYLGDLDVDVCIICMDNKWVLKR